MNLNEIIYLFYSKYMYLKSDLLICFYFINIIYFINIYIYILNFFISTSLYLSIEQVINLKGICLHLYLV